MVSFLASSFSSARCLLELDIAFESTGKPQEEPARLGLVQLFYGPYLNELFHYGLLHPSLLECHSFPYSHGKHSLLLGDLFPWGQAVLCKHAGFFILLVPCFRKSLFSTYFKSFASFSAKAKCLFALLCPEPHRASAWQEQHFRKHHGGDYCKSKMKIVRSGPLFTPLIHTPCLLSLC